MCGICGIYHATGQLADSNLVARMTGLLRHRGPDEQGTYAAGPVALGTARLAIIDLSPAAHQPMPNEDETVWIVYNGEVYNHGELRGELEARGHRYRSRSDTETVLHLYEEYGQNCLQHLRGMYAFAIWDAQQHKLFLAVDRFGVKPLYYTQAGGAFIFGSELKAILQHPAVRREIDVQSLDEYLRYCYVPAPRTIFKDIQRLPPAHYMVVQDGRVEIRQYWELRFEPDYNRTEAEWVEATRELLAECVRMRLMSDVPLGALLSGGIDSSSVVALMGQASSEPVETFTIGFETAALDFQGYDERADARIVARHFSTDHHELVVEPRLTEVLPRIIWHFDEPFANATAIPTYYLAQMTKDHVTVALAGVGGDELFGGYPRYPGARWLQRYFWLPPLIREEVVPAIVKRLPEGSSDYLLSNRLKKYFGRVGPTLEATYRNWMSFLDNTMPIYSPEVMEQLVPRYASTTLDEHFRAAEGWNFVNKVMFVDIKTYLPDNLLAYSDRMSMAHSLEVRVPFCDHRLAELAATIPPELKVKGFTLKYLLKQVMRDLLPLHILNKRKQGFSVPLGHWIRHDLRPLAEWALSPARIRQRGYFDAGAVDALWQTHLSGKVNYAHNLWALIVFDLWHTLYIDEAITSEPTVDLTALIEA